MIDVDWLGQEKIPDDEPKLHPDLRQNRQYAKTFIERIRPLLSKGIGIAVGGSMAMPESLIWVKYKPPGGIPVGDYAYAINLNGSHAEVKKELEFYYKSYQEMAKNVEAKYCRPKINQPHT